MNDAIEKVPYNHPTVPVYMGKGVVGDGRNFFYRSYWHGDIELVCILKGSICYSVNGETIKLTQGQSLFINSNQIHYNFSEDMQYCEFICVNFNPLMLIDKKMAEVEQDFLNRPVWNKKAVLNVARIGKFSSDRSTKEYADKIWNIKPC